MFEKKHFETIPSTHKWALEQDPKAFDTPLLITADVQTDSVGRREGTSWLAPPKTSLIATFFIPKFESQDAHNLAQLLACSLCTELNTLSIFPVFKWPNDLILSHKKLGGAMADIQKGAAVISCGLNINTQKEDLDKVDIPATSLYHETKRSYDIKSIEDKLALRFTSDLLRFKQEGFAPFAKMMNQYLAFKEQAVKIEEAPIKTGIVKEIAPDGRLLVIAGEKEHLLTRGSLHSNY